MEKYGIWDKHSGSATLGFLAFLRNHAALHINVQIKILGNMSSTLLTRA
jgi:hypothetical protein